LLLLLLLLATRQCFIRVPYLMQIQTLFAFQLYVLPSPGLCEAQQLTLQGSQLSMNACMHE
jgi:hypothetical protein